MAVEKIRKIRELLRAGLARLERRLRSAPGADAESCGDGCYTLSDGTVVPMGDLGVGPTEYKLKP